MQAATLHTATSTNQPTKWPTTATNFENGSSRSQVTAPTSREHTSHQKNCIFGSRDQEADSSRWQTRSTTARASIPTQAVVIAKADTPRPQMKKARNMGGYCHSHGFQPISTYHTSANCSWKKNGHKDEAIWTNPLGGDTFWPSAKHAMINQQNHAT
jgi:hypothetical protein